MKTLSQQVRAITKNPEQHVRRLLEFSRELTDDAQIRSKMTILLSSTVARVIMDSVDIDVAKEYAKAVIPVLGKTLRMETKDDTDDDSGVLSRLKAIIDSHNIGRNPEEPEEKNKKKDHIDPKALFKGNEVKPKEIEPHPNKERFEELMRKVAEMNENQD